MYGTIAYTVIAAAFLAVCLAVVRAVRILRAVNLGRDVPAAEETAPRAKIFLTSGIPSSLGTFFSKTTPAVLHSVLALSFILMAADFILTLASQIIPAIRGGGLSAALAKANATLAAAAILASAIFILRRLSGKVSRFNALSGKQKRDAYTVLILEMLSAGTFLAYHFTRGHWGMVHYALMVFFLLYITFSKHLHIFSALPYMIMSAGKKAFSPPGVPAVTAAIDIMEGKTAETSAQDTIMGARDYCDLPRTCIAASLACTECGRCDRACPVNMLPGQQLSPRNIISSVRHAAMGSAKDKHLYPDYVTHSQAFSCISCGACAQACPIGIDPLAVLLEIRRYATLEEGSAPAEYVRAGQATVSAGNPWGFTEEEEEEEK